TEWSWSLRSTSVARERVGSTLASRLGPLISSQIRLASATACSWESEAYCAKYDAGSRKAVSRRRRKRSVYQRRMSLVAASTYTEKSKKSQTASPQCPEA